MHGVMFVSVLELVDRSDLKSDVRLDVWVQFPPLIYRVSTMHRAWYGGIALIAQLVERLTENEEVADSSSA